MSESIIKTENIDVHFGKLHVLKGVSLDVKPNEVVCIIGPSGAGKSTFLRTLNHLEKIDSGKIYVDGKLLDDYEHGKKTSRCPKRSAQRSCLKWAWSSSALICSRTKLCLKT